MSLKKKLLLTISLIAIFSTILSLFLISKLSLEQMREEAIRKAELDLTAKRTLISSELNSYIDTINNQAVVMAHDISTQEAAKQFTKAFFAYDVSSADKLSLTSYYETQFKSVYDQQNRDSISVSKLYNNLSATSLALQSQFISLNQYPIGEKDKLTALNDSSLYDTAHQRYHSTFRTFLQKFGYYDVFIVEPDQGYIVYSVFKELDYATSLKSGPYKNSGIAKAFNEALKLSDGETHLTDFAPYLPSYNNAASFVSTPIFDNGSLIGVLVFQLPIDRINNLMTQKGKWVESGFGESGEIYLVGADKTLRNESRFYSEDQSAYLSLIESVGMKEATRIANKETTIAIQPVNSSGVNEALAGQTGFDVFDDYRNVPVFSSYGPFMFGNHRWAIMSEIDEEEALRATNQLANYIWGVAATITIVMVIVALLLALQLTYTLTKPLTALSDRFSSLVEGEADLTVRLEQSNTPEINLIVRDFNTFIGQIAETFSSTKQAVSRIASSGTELGVTTEQTKVALQEQEDSIHQVLESVEQFSESIAEITGQTEDALSESNEAKDKTEENSERASLAADNIKQLVEEVELSSQTIKTLQSSVGDIGDVLSVINSIAEQTNLLALNAAIEAARAGEHGRGFAVVADEVRNLASRTQESTVTIQSQIEKLTQSAEHSFDSMERASVSALGGIHLVNEVNESLHELKETIVKLSAMSSEIATSTQMQGHSIQFINESMEALNERASEITGASSNIAGVATELASVAEQLQSDTDRYQV
ncbi:MAG: methyl-accepting chemotaxis protein [Gammaproteobacteria bacterium]|nr:methyl-accepting chemotaxis protein [Gammaproteobacteria bacterium]